MLLEKSKLTLLGSVPQLTQTLDSLEASGVLATRNNLTLVLHEILLLQTTGSVLGRAVPDLSLGSNSDLRTTHHVHRVSVILAGILAIHLTILASHVTTTSLHSSTRSINSVVRKIFGFHYTST